MRDGDDVDGVPAETWRAFDPVLETQACYLLFADGTSDDTEPDIATLTQDQVSEVDEYLHRALLEHYEAQEEQILQWMGSQLNVTPDIRALITAYIVSDEGERRQVIAARLPIAGRKVVVIGNFDVAQADRLAAPVFNAIRGITIYSPQ